MAEPIYISIRRWTYN